MELIESYKEIVQVKIFGFVVKETIRTHYSMPYVKTRPVEVDTYE